MNAVQIIEEFTVFMQKEDSVCRHWFVGTTSRSADETLRRHGVRGDMDPWIYRLAESQEVAVSVQDYFHRLGAGADTSPERDDKEAAAVYAYLMFEHTNP